MTKPSLYIIVAVDKNFGIGKEGKMPWAFSKEMKHFKDTTLATEDAEKQNMVIMGRTTWESIPGKYRPLQGRRNAVLTSNKEYKAGGAKVFSSIRAAIDSADEEIEKIFIIGGGKLYAQAVEIADLDGIYVTKIDHSYECDTFFPEIPKELPRMEELSSDEEDGVSFKYLLYKR